MGVFQVHRRGAQSAWKHLHKTVNHRRNIWFSSCSHLHGGLRSPCSQKASFLLPSKSDAFYNPVFAELISIWTIPSAVTAVYIQLQSSLNQICILHQKSYNLSTLNTGWKLSLLSWQHAKHAWFCWGAGNTMPVTFLLNVGENAGWNLYQVQ